MLIEMVTDSLARLCYNVYLPWMPTQCVQLVKQHGSGSSYIAVVAPDRGTKAWILLITSQLTVLSCFILPGKDSIAAGFLSSSPRGSQKKPRCFLHHPLRGCVDL